MHSRFKDDCPFDTICYLSQQCAEKYLKSLLVFRAVSFPKTHDLVILLRLVASNMTIDELREVSTLNR